MNRTLIVNADDYGLTRAVSSGILRAHQKGILTSTSVLVLGSGFDASVGWLRDEASLGVGVHLALVGEDPPLLSAAEIPTLVDKRGRLPISWRRLLPLVAARRVDPGDITREFSAQIEAVEGAGLSIDHLDSHQHVHMFPVIREVVVDLAHRHSVPCVRVTRSSGRGVIGRVMARLSGRLERELSLDGLRFTTASAGLDEAGRCDLATTVRAIAALGRSGATFAELSGHPGEHEDSERHRYKWGYAWGAELDAWLAPQARDAVTAQGFILGTYRDLAAVPA